MKMNVWSLSLLVAILGFSGLSQSARANNPEFRRYTSIVTHSAYTDIYANSYNILERELNRNAFDFCAIQLDIRVLSEPGLFRKGQHYGEFVARCFNPNVRDVALSFYVYPYDEETQSKLEITLNSGERKVINTCWKHSGRVLDCNTRPGFNTLQPNFTLNQPPVR